MNEKYKIKINNLINKCKKYNIVLNDKIIKQIEHDLPLLLENDKIKAKYHIPRKIFNILLYDKKLTDMNFYQRIIDTSNCKLTLENMIKRYGEEEGTKRWDSYCYKQMYAGSSLQYFIDKFGEEEGIKRWNKVCKSKANNIENVMKRYNLTKEQAIKKLSTYYTNNRRNFYSKISQKLFWDIYKNIPPKLQQSTYFAELNNEFGKYNDEIKKYNLYDFVINDIKFCIEFQGDHYHGNPAFYKPSDYLKARGVTKILVKDKWLEDEIKNNVLKKLNYDVIIIWESDYENNKEIILEKCLTKINQLSKLHNIK